MHGLMRAGRSRLLRGFALAGAIAPPGGPGVPIVIGTPGAGRVTLSYAAPGAGEARIVDYYAEYKLATDTGWTVLTDVLFNPAGIVVTGLTNDAAYQFRLKARNGNYSNVVSATPSAALETMPAAQTVSFGAGTRVGFGGHPLGYTGTKTLVITGGNASAHWQIDAYNKLVPKNGSAAWGTAPPAWLPSYTLTVSTSDGALTSTVTIAMVSNTFSAAPDGDNQAGRSLGFVLYYGDQVVLRDGQWNGSVADIRVGVPSLSQRVGGPAAPTSDTDPGWVSFRAENWRRARWTKFIISRGGSNNAYLSVEDLDFYWPSTGPSGSSFCLTMLTSSISSFVRVRGNRFRSLFWASNLNANSGVTLGGAQATIGDCGSYWIQDNDFEELANGVNMTAIDVIIEHNRFMRLTTDVMHPNIVASQPGRSLIQYNICLGSPNVVGNHSDFVQCDYPQVPVADYNGPWIIGNISMRGVGTPGLQDKQGLFTSNLPTGARLLNVRLTGNIIVSTYVNGILLNGCVGAQVFNNTILQDQQGDSGTLDAPRINIGSGGAAGRNLVHSNNGTSANITGDATSTIQTDNVKITVAQYAATFPNLNYLPLMDFAAVRAMFTPAPASVAFLPGGAVAGAVDGAGSPIT